MTCASFGPRGWPHLMPLWYVVRQGTLWSWTYAKSQKVRNLERDLRCTLQIEAGRDVYHELRGVMFECEAAIHRDLETVAGVGMELAGRYGGEREPSPEMRAAFERAGRQARRAGVHRAPPRDVGPPQARGARPH